VIAEFPSFEAAKAWYESPTYQAIRHHRLKGAIYSGLVVQGFAANIGDPDGYNIEIAYKPWLYK